MGCLFLYPAKHLQLPSLSGTQFALIAFLHYPLLPSPGVRANLACKGRLASTPILPPVFAGVQLLLDQNVQLSSLAAWHYPDRSSPNMPFTHLGDKVHLAPRRKLGIIIPSPISTTSVSMALSLPQVLPYSPPHLTRPTACISLHSSQIFSEQEKHIKPTVPAQTKRPFQSPLDS
eukprot:TRINITY_DN36650_c0_g1_i1.p1 TRINITY_DN36650_c0_g1~~TRINITY_DN36650_c0_g1_i1.p1  ORF type:complete len:175 (+),score=1.69 TRINITY_DN36650_c0_g1_i1:470-994(+)